MDQSVVLTVIVEDSTIITNDNNPKTDVAQLAEGERCETLDVIAPDLDYSDTANWRFHCNDNFKQFLVQNVPQ